MQAWKHISDEGHCEQYISKGDNHTTMCLLCVRNKIWSRAAIASVKQNINRYTTKQRIEIC